MNEVYTDLERQPIESKEIKYYKIVYNINNSIRTIIEDALIEANTTEEIISISTGKAGIFMLKSLNSKYKDILTWDKKFDPLYADDLVNPLMMGWRLSSFCFFIRTSDMLIKLIPKNIPIEKIIEMITLDEFTKLFNEMWDSKTAPKEYKLPPMSKVAKELFNKAFEEAYLKDTYGDKWNMTYEDLRSRVLVGYGYSTVDNNTPSNKGGRKIKLNTGYGGVHIMIDEFEKQGAPAILAAESILCHTDQGAYPLSKLTVKKIKNKE